MVQLVLKHHYSTSAKIIDHVTLAVKLGATTIATLLLQLAMDSFSKVARKIESCKNSEKQYFT